MSQEDDDGWMALVEDTLGAGGRLMRGSAEFDRAFDHVWGLLRDSAGLFERRSYATSLFLAITALEEVAKLSVGMSRHSNEPSRRSQDPLFSHRKKHHLAARPTVLVGSRLTEAIGEDAIAEIMDAARSGALVALRESSLYVAGAAGGLLLPSEVITPKKARQVLLFSLEAFDDALVGYTNRSMEAGVVADQIFERVRSAA